MSRVLVLLALLAVGCDSQSTVSLDAVTVSAGPVDLRFDGHVTYADVEGGAWVLRDDSGTAYEPTNLPARFRVEDQRVRVEADVLEDLASTLQVGPVIEIRTVTPLEGPPSRD